MRQTRSQTRTKSVADNNGNSAKSLEYNELKAIIDSFNNKELSDLVGIQTVHNQVASSVLRQRALLLLDTSFPSTRRKIREIDNSRKVLTQPPTPQMYHHHQDVNMVLSQGNGATNHPNGTNNGVVVYNQNTPQHNQTQNSITLKKLAFFEVMGTLLKPTMLMASNNQRVQEGTYYFQLTPQQANEISLNRDTRNVSKPEFLVQVQLRFCSLESAPSFEQQDDYFPPNIVVKVNNKMCALPNPIPTNKPNAEPKRPPRPVNITPNVKISPTTTNQISVSWCSDYNRSYVVSVYLVKKLSSAHLLNGMKMEQKIQPSDATRAMIKDKLNEDADCEIATTTLNVTLVCPLGKMKMKTPCRASTCSHFQCFDAETYLQMNEKKPTWNCPVCDKPAPYEKLVIDAYFQEVLSSADTNEIQLNKDGSWSTHVVGNDAQSLDTPHKKYQSVDISDDTVPEVDLTQSDSDDDVPIKRNQPPPKQIASNSTTVNAAAAPRTNDMSIISLDSPTPPSSPVNNMSSNAYVDTPPSHMINTNSGVSSTTQNNWTSPSLNSLANNHNLLPSSPLLQDPLGGVYNDFYHQRQLLQNNSPIMYPYPSADDENRIGKQNEHDKMPVYCSVPNYNTKGTYDKHRFPADSQLKQNWTNATKAHHLQDSRSGRICRRHFEDKDLLLESEY
ncbi:E3 SUMO-protein ligase PIAS3 [Pseudolycoriella hygida]|uniref:E3 SUMO-protein ligase PIAS3 n=1 Tax=Pseudolycoriella hygida TaxID=35572 RepID=A0A9Q0S458_9DIPT|nr:E3 SUMO-protein ligase PIAS3 [Pseudolycoriella hygida]